MQQWDWFMGIRARRLSSRFVIGSLLLHAAIVGLFLLRLPSHFVLPIVTPPLMVTILDPDAVRELPIGPTTHLPPKPQNLEPRPRGPKAAAPVQPSPGSNAGGTRVTPSDAPVPSQLRDTPMMKRPADPSEAGESSVPSPSAKRPDAVAPQPSEGTAEPGLPFASREEINRLAKLFTEKPSPSKEPYTVNTEDLQYLSYIAQIARTLELIWKYPKEAVERGQQGETVLKVIILENGTLQVAQLLQTSGHPLLDNEALRAVKRIAPYPPLPKSWHQSQWDLTISFTYYLDKVVVGVI